MRIRKIIVLLLAVVGLLLATWIVAGPRRSMPYRVEPLQFRFLRMRNDVDAMAPLRAEWSFSRRRGPPISW